MAVFVDSGAWIALANRRDDCHQAATAYLSRVLAERTTLVTSNLVIAEALTRIRYDLGHGPALRFLSLIEEAEQSRWLVVSRVETAVEEEARGIFRQYNDQVFSFVDCTSFALIRRLGLQEVFGFDRDFLTAGFVLRPGS